MAIANDTEWHNRSAIDVLAQLNSSATGLTTQDAQQRIKVDGSNELQESRRVSLLWIFLGQFKSLIIWILVAYHAREYSGGDKNPDDETLELAEEDPERADTLGFPQLVWTIGFEALLCILRGQSGG